MIKVNNISKKLNEKTILNNVSFIIKDKEIVGICGKSGEGKSTLGKILAGFIKYDSGEIYLNDTKLENGKLNKDIKIIFQQVFASLDPKQKIIKGLKEVILYNKLASKDNVDNYIDELLKLIELDKDILNHLPSQISGGEASRIVILKALIFKPKLLILDESTSMLDSLTEVNILTKVKSIVKEYTGSILIISHDEKLLSLYCDKVYKLEEGELKDYEKTN